MKRLIGSAIVIMMVVSVLSCGKKKAETPVGLAKEALEYKKTAAEEILIGQPGALVTPLPEVTEGAKPDREKLSDEAVDELITEVKERLGEQSLLAERGGPNPIVLLGRSRDVEAVTVLGEVLDCSLEPLARRQAARALGMIRDPEAIEALKPALQDEYIWVRLTAALSLARQGEKDEPLTVFSEIITRRGADNWKHILRAVIDGSGGISEAELKKRKDTLGKLKNQTFPLLALSGLNTINTEEALEVVKIALDDDNPSVRRKAEKIVERSSRE